MKKIVCLLICSVFGSAQAVPMYFTDRASFDVAAGGGLSFEDFEADFSVASSVAFADFTVSETGGVNLLGQARNFPGLLDAAITGGTGALLYDDNGSSIGSFFSFSSAITAFGIDLTTSDASTVTIGGSVSDAILLSANSPSFWGVIDVAGISSISFDASGGPNVGFDSASYGFASASVPEPSTLALLGLGLAGIGFSRKKKSV